MISKLEWAKGGNENENDEIESDIPDALFQTLRNHAWRLLFFNTDFW
jgi:hypothetical protein